MTICKKVGAKMTKNKTNTGENTPDTNEIQRLRAEYVKKCTEIGHFYMEAQRIQRRIETLRDNVFEMDVNFEALVNAKRDEAASAPGDKDVTP